MAVIINAGSGSGGSSEIAADVCARFSARGLQPSICVCAGGAEIRRHAEEAMASGSRLLVAGGGDGTVSTVASIVAGTDAALGVLPLGTLNHFAKDAGIPLDLEEAVAAIADGHVMPLDVGEVNGRVFINNSSLGLYPMIVRHREARQRLGTSKWWAFLRGVLTALGWYPMLHVSLSSGEGRIERHTPFLFVGNNEYEIHGLKIGTRSRIDSGELSVYLANQVGRVGLILLALRALAGRLREAAAFDMLSTTEVRVSLHSRRPVRVALDGEVAVMAPPLLYRCRPRDLRVIVPKSGEQPAAAAG